MMPMTFSSTHLNACKNSGKNRTTLAVLPLVLVSTAIATYARSSSNHTHAEQYSSTNADKNLHQHIAYPWKGTR
jgi:hypothetical protein